MTVITFPPTGRFEAVLESARRQPSPREAVRQMLSDSISESRVERFELRAWANGYCIYDRGELIATFHGPQLALASRLLRLLQEDAARGPEVA